MYAVTVETSCTSELKRVYPPMSKKNHNYWRSEQSMKLRKEVMTTRRRAREQWREELETRHSGFRSCGKRRGR
jgi:hypothetical protein